MQFFNFLFALVAAILRHSRSTANSCEVYEMTNGERAYWEEVEAARAAEEAQLEKELRRAWLHLEESAADEARADAGDEEYARRCEEADLRELRYLASQERDDEAWRYDHLGDNPLV